MKDLLELVETLIKAYSEDILRAVRREDRRFFELPIYERERYVNLTKVFPRTLLSTLQENGVRQLAEDQTLPDEPQFYNDWGGESGKEGYKAGIEAIRKAGFARVQSLLPPSV